MSPSVSVRSSLGRTRSVRAAHSAMPLRQAIHKRSVRANAGDDLSFKVVANDDWPPVIASALFIALKQGVITFGSEELRMVLALSALSLPMVNVLTNREKYNWVSSNLAPAALAAEVLSVMTAVQASVVAFGSNLCSKLAGFVNVKGAFYALLASLALAVYYNYATLWYCSGFALLTGSRFVESVRGGKVLVVPGILTAALLYGLFDYVRSKSMVVCTEVTYCLIAAQVFWAIFNTGRTLADEVSE